MNEYTHWRANDTYVSFQTWGYLFPAADNFSQIRLTDDKVSFGRSTSNTHVLLESHMGKQLIQSISKCHFVLRRSNEGVVTIEDYSSNGTYINGERFRCSLGSSHGYLAKL